MSPLSLIPCALSSPFRDLFPLHSFLFEESSPFPVVEVEQQLQRDPFPMRFLEPFESFLRSDEEGG